MTSPRLEVRERKVTHKIAAMIRRRRALMAILVRAPPA